MKGLIWVIVILIVLLAIGGGLIGSYNSLVTKSQAVDEKWSQVETQYQRRFDLVPNLVTTVKAFMGQELAVFKEITDARAAYGAAPTADGKAVAGGELEAAIAKLLVIVEDNPEIKSQETVIQLLDELAGTENRISVERGRYNQAVRTYNTAIKTFPGNLMAGMFGFAVREYFESVSGADLAPVVEF